ncbi:hypothetical protein LRAMOSA06326 [Lichtheimia ramosa]|uniref:Major facilitator superfamily (MFS) profile domain-containing protein n=1 Tax=Lichtheimia ramosa TaxID=688394 RepID=A0A077X2V1_9FUNG|nr:hypothetical protein LRAMOSA06326 [Lichtheimia ramosa]
MERREETTPLLNDTLSPAGYKTTSVASDNDDCITILTSNPPSLASRRSSTSSSSSKGTTQKQDDIVARRLNGASLLTVLGSIWVAVTLGSLDSSIVATIYAQIGTEFQKSNEIVWIATAYLLSYTALQPLYGRISDVFGRKSALLFATVVFFIGSLLCGAAPNLWSLVVARLVAGLGGGGINTLTTVIISDLVSLRDRGKYQGYGNMAYGLGSLMGGPLGGLITDTVGWRWCFYINLPLLLVTIYVASCVMTNYNLKERNDNSTLMQRLKMIDWLGAGTIVTAVVAFMVATSLGGNTRPWSDPFVLGCLAASVVLTILFGVVEAKIADNPLMPWSIITSRTPLACSLTNFWALMATMSSVYMIPLYLQAVLGNSPTRAGLYLMPRIVSLSCGSVFSGFFISRTGEYKGITITAAFTLVVATTGYSFWTATTPLWFVFITTILDGASLGILITTTLIAMLSTIAASEMATITSMSYLFRSAGGVIGISVTSAVFQAAVKHILSEKITGPDAEKYIEIARQSMSEVRSLLPADILDIVLDAYEVALRYSFYSMMAMAALAFISTLFIQRFELSTKVSK